MRIDVVTLFPDMVLQAARIGVTGRALERGLWKLAVWNPRDFATDAHRTVDDRPYGGGPGMVMLPGPLLLAVAAAKEAQAQDGVARSHVIHLSPAGAPVTHERVVGLAADTATGYVLIASRYEGIDERVVMRCVDEELSVGDFVVSGGELPALMLVDAMARLLPGALNDEDSAQQDSFAAGLLDCPHYTRPEVFEGLAVPDVLLSGHHENIRRWRLAQSLRRTQKRRPDLLAGRTLTKDEAAVLGPGGQETQQETRTSATDSLRCAPHAKESKR